MAPLCQERLLDAVIKYEDPFFKNNAKIPAVFLRQQHRVIFSELTY